MTNAQMAQDELLAAFGLNAPVKDKPQDADQKLAVRDLKAEEDAWSERPDTAFAIDEYDRMKGRDIAENPDYAGLWDVEVETTDEHGAKVTKTIDLKPDNEMLADCFNAAFEIEPKLNKVSKDEQRRSFFEALTQTEDYRALHKRTTLDATASELASLAFAQQVVSLRAESQVNGNPQHANPDRQQFLNDMRNASRAAQAASQACQDVSDYDAACNAFGGGDQAGGGGKMDAKTLAALFKEVRSSDQLRRICELAGKYRMVAQAAQRRKVNHGMDDVVGVELSGDIGRAVPSELACLADEDLEMLTLRRFLERGLISRKHEGVEKVAKGPIMFFVDESGSMSGEKSYQSKALGLALAWVAQKQKRWFCLNAFSSYYRSGNAADVEQEITNQLRTIVVGPGESKMGEMMEWMVEFQNGGTNVEFLHASTISAIYAKTKAEVGKTDIVLLTDGEVSVSPELLASFNGWKQATQTTLHTIIIPPGNERSQKGLADRTYILDRLDFDADGVGEVLSI